MNSIVLLGRMTKDAEVKYTSTGKVVASFSLAVDRPYTGEDGKHEADFINCVAWRQTGEFIARYFQKGSMIAVVGSIQSRSWDGQDGKRQYATVVVADELAFNGPKVQNNDVPVQGMNPDYAGFVDINDEDDLPF